MDTTKNRWTRQLFDGIADQYDLLLELLTFWQNRRWHRFLIARLGAGTGDRVLDLCTGTGGVAIQIARQRKSRVTGLDLSQNMLRKGGQNVRRQGLGSLITLVQGRAEEMGFPDDSFDAVAFTYLLRYVDDVEATLKEIVRVLKPGGRLASLDFAVPQHSLFRALWLLYTRAVLPGVVRVISPGWRRVGAFLGPNISQFYSHYDVEDIRRIWMDAGITDASLRRMSLGGAVIMWGTKGSKEHPEGVPESVALSLPDDIL